MYNLLHKIISLDCFLTAEKTLLLITCSVAKKSTEFWIEATSNEANPWHSIAINNSQGGGTQEGGDVLAAKVNWGRILADVGGAVLGAGIGIGVGLINPLAGGAVGAAAVTALTVAFSAAVSSI